MNKMMFLNRLSTHLWQRFAWKSTNQVHGCDQFHEVLKKTLVNGTAQLWHMPQRWDQVDSSNSDFPHLVTFQVDQSSWFSCEVLRKPSAPNKDILVASFPPCRTLWRTNQLPLGVILRGHWQQESYSHLHNWTITSVHDVNSQVLCEVI